MRKHNSGGIKHYYLVRLATHTSKFKAWWLGWRYGLPNEYYTVKIIVETGDYVAATDVYGSYVELYRPVNVLDIMIDDCYGSEEEPNRGSGSTEFLRNINRQLPEDIQFREFELLKEYTNPAGIPERG